jgi:hypothetical protein
MATKTELVNELSRLTGEQKKDFNGMKKNELIILLHETQKRKDLRPTYGKHVWLVSPRSRPKRKSSNRRKSPVKSSPKRRISRSRPKSRRRRSRTPTPYLHRSKGVSWGGKHVLFRTPVRRRSSGKRSRSILKAKRSYKARISYSPRKSTREILAIANRHSHTHVRHRSGKVGSPTKKYYVDNLSRFTGRKKSVYNSLSKEELKQRMKAVAKEHCMSEHGTNLWLRTPPKCSGSRRTSRRRSRKKSSKTKKPCKSYQRRNENGRCANKPCKEGKIRDKVSKKCRKKKN